jgi:hypothetical protein
MSKARSETRPMRIKNKRVNYIGRMARVRSSFDGEALPDGLPEGATVRIVGFEIGRFGVEHQGRMFKIPMICVENLHQLWSTSGHSSRPAGASDPPAPLRDQPDSMLRDQT